MRREPPAPPIVSVLATALVAVACAQPPPASDAELLALDAPALERELISGKVSAEQVTRAALARIEALDDQGPALHAILEISPEAVEIARALDRRFAAQGPVGPLHGLPVVLKANIDTGDRMATSAGSLALADHHAPADAELVSRLRDAGAVIIAKGNLSEWANIRSTHATSGWSSAGGQTHNPYVLDRTPCGSSSGPAVAVAARFVPLAVGTETNGSIVCPAGMNGIVGIKPTLGLVSRNGIIPIAASQDTAGPLARTVEGAAMLLAAMRSEAPAGGRDAEPGGGRDTESGGGLDAELAGGLDAEPGGAEGAELTGLSGIRLGVVRDYAGAGDHRQVETAFEGWLEALAAAGAELVDPVELDLPPGFGAAELEVLLYEFKAGINAYLAAEHVEPASLEELIRYDREHAADVMPYFGQELFLEAASRGGLDEPGYREAVAQSQQALRARLEALFAAEELDALVAPANEPAPKIDLAAGDRISLSSSSIAAVSGYPSVAVPAGLVGGLPVAIAFVGRPHSEASLIEIASAFERARGPMPAPGFLPTLH